MTIDEYLTDFTARDWRQLDAGTLRIAMVGLGWWTREEAIPAVADSEFCETTVVVSGDSDKADAVRRSTATVEETLSYDEFLDGDAVDAYDAVYVCTPNAFHLPYVETAAEHGKAVLCEKPLEATLPRAEKLVAAAEDIPLMTAYRMQTDPAIRRVRELVRNGAVGDVVSVHGHMAQRILETVSEDPDQWRLDPDRTGYGATVMDLGIYPLNTARFVLDADPVAVTAMMHSDDEVFGSVPDEHAVFTVVFDDDTYAACTASQNASLSGHLRLVGTEGEICVEPVFHGESPQTVTLRLRDGRVTRLDDGRRDVVGHEMREEFDYFADRVLRSEPPEPDGEHALVDMRTLEAIYRAAEHGEEVTVT